MVLTVSGLISVASLVAGRTRVALCAKVRRAGARSGARSWSSQRNRLITRVRSLISASAVIDRQPDRAGVFIQHHRRQIGSLAQSQAQPLFYSPWNETAEAHATQFAEAVGRFLETSLPNSA